MLSRVLLIHLLGGMLSLAIILPAAGQKRLPKTTQWEQEADTLMKHEKFAEAAPLYNKLIKRLKRGTPAFDNIQYKRALCSYRLEDWDAALADITDFISRNPASSKAFLLRALIYQQLGEEKKILADVEKAIQSGTPSPSLLSWHASLLLGDGQYEKAKKAFIDLLKLTKDPEFETKLAVAYHELGQRDSAFLHIENAIALDNQFTGTYLYAASLNLSDENYAEALTYLNRGLRVDPKQAALLFYKGVALMELKRLDEACSCWRKALEAGDDDSIDYLKEYCYDIFK